MFEEKKIAAFFAAIMLLCPVVHAGDHLSESNSCTPCHGTNIRKVHDYAETVPTDCTICHVTAGSDWYLNDTCADYLATGGVPVMEVEPGCWALDIEEWVDFNFACKACHVGENPGHQQ